MGVPEEVGRKPPASPPCSGPEREAWKWGRRSESRVNLLARRPPPGITNAPLFAPANWGDGGSEKLTHLGELCHRIWDSGPPMQARWFFERFRIQAALSLMGHGWPRVWVQMQIWDLEVLPLGGRGALGLLFQGPQLNARGGGAMELPGAGGLGTSGR